MKHEILQPSLLISDTTTSFNEIYKKAYFPVEYADDIKKANLLIIPEEHFQDREGLFFPETTLEFYQYLKDHADSQLTPDIAISDKDFLKVELHSAVIIIATFIIVQIAFPLAINLLSSFLYDQAKKHHRKPSELDAEINIIVEDGTSSKHISYNGPVAGIKDALSASIPNLFPIEDSDEQK